VQHAGNPCARGLPILHQRGRRADADFRLDRCRLLDLRVRRADPPQPAGRADPALEAFTIADSGRVWTVREIAKHAAIGGRGPVVVGSPEEVAEELIAWVDETDLDGFNLAYAVMPETFVDFVDLVVPELQRRGRYKLDYAPGTLREKLYGSGRARLGADHPAARFR
jgi:alkanesulfonate monooxygenase SsuD/methylene tetrahydromethanopterin reductase-like flavin-dependent oxidoreductase (luciferase family)